MRSKCRGVGDLVWGAEKGSTPWGSAGLAPWHPTQPQHTDPISHPTAFHGLPSAPKSLPSSYTSRPSPSWLQQKPPGRGELLPRRLGACWKPSPAAIRVMQGSSLIECLFCMLKIESDRLPPCAGGRENHIQLIERLQQQKD